MSYTIKKVRSNGHLVYLVTGRALSEVYQDAYDMGFDGIIGGNGSYIESEGEVIFEKSLTKEECTHFVDWCRKNNVILGILRPSLLAGKGAPGNLGQGDTGNRQLQIPSE